MLDRPDRLCSPCDHDGHTCAAFGCAQEVSGMDVIEHDDPDRHAITTALMAGFERDGEQGRFADYASAWCAGWIACREHRPGALQDFERVGKLAEWIVRDRGERDKVTAYAGELEALARRHGGQ